jgi:uncharacterized membrane protein YgcG
MYKLILLFLLGICVSCENKNHAARSLSLKNRIIDNAGLLTKDQEDSIFYLIKKLELQIGSQIALITIDSLGGQKIEEFSINIADSLKLGRATHNDGVLITVSLKDRTARIEVGTGLENIIKDEIAAEIIREELAPKFREENYGKGLFLVVEEISKLITDNKDLVGKEPQ